MGKKLLLLVVLALCSSCAQLSLFQDAKTLGKGNKSIGGHISGYGIVDIDGNDDIILPSIVANGSYGVTDRLDLQFSVSLAGSFLFSPKLQLLGNRNSKWAFALNPGIATHVGSFEEEELGILRTHYSAIGSYHPSDKVSIFFEPRYINQYRRDQSNDHFYGSTLGLCYKTSKVLDLTAGASFFDVKNSSELLIQLGVGVNYRFIKE